MKSEMEENKCGEQRFLGDVFLVKKQEKEGDESVYPVYVTVKIMFPWSEQNHGIVEGPCVLTLIKR